jgi:hypothetical protein
VLSQLPVFGPILLQSDDAENFAQVIFEPLVTRAKRSRCATLALCREPAVASKSISRWPPSPTIFKAHGG